ncbi:hypothetical protein M5689_021601 [Euphorbia peplus]|nr:hypothetical protein M5689_021601 [Euphorbia peplus]
MPCPRKLVPKITLCGAKIQRPLREEAADVAALFPILKEALRMCGYTLQFGFKLVAHSVEVLQLLMTTPISHSFSTIPSIITQQVLPIVARLISSIDNLSPGMNSEIARISRSFDYLNTHLLLYNSCLSTIYTEQKIAFNNFEQTQSDP